MINLKVPRWYQDLSIPQMEMIRWLGKLIKHDYREKITDRTQIALRKIGITSTYVRITPKDIRNLWIISNLDPVKFLSEIYRFITGQSFEHEAYKKFYDCNERIVLSSIAFLKLPEVILELHRRLPIGKIHKIPPKPTPPKEFYKKSVESPYLEYPRSPPDWRPYRNELHKWEEKRKSIVNPRIILPTLCWIDNENQNIIENNNEEIFENQVVKPEIFKTEIKINVPKNNTHDIPKIGQESEKKTQKSYQPSPLPQKEQSVQSSKTSDLIAFIKTSSVSAISQKLNEIQEDSLVDRLVSTDEENRIEGIDEKLEDGDADITSYFADLPRKSYPPGRENLSPKWQDFLMDVDENFVSLEKEANDILRRVHETTKHIFNPDVCDDCCACIQSRLIVEKSKNEKNSNLIIENVILDETGNRYVVGSLGITSPAQSISDSSLMKPLIIPSEDQIFKTSIIDSITFDEKGQPLLISSGISKQINHIPERILEKPPLPRKNVPSCDCKENQGENGQNEENNLSVENTSICPNEESNCMAETFRKKLFNKCGKCCISSNNEIFLKFEGKFREREKIEQERKEMEKNQRNIRHHFIKVEKEPKSAEEPPKIVEKCTKCGNSPEKCRPPNPLREFLRNLVKEKEKGRKKPSKKSGIKEYRENLKFSVAGVADDNTNLIELGGITLHTPITITPESSEEEIVYKSGSKHRHWSVTEFHPKPSAQLQKIENILKNYPSKREFQKKSQKLNQTPDDKISQLFNQLKTMEVIYPSLKNIPEDIEDVKYIKSIKNIPKLEPEKKIKQEPGIKNSEFSKKEGENTFKNHEKKSKDARFTTGMQNEEQTKKVQSKHRKEDNFYKDIKIEEQKKYARKPNLQKLMKEALQEMAAEGYIFAKLPQCHKIPMLQMWIEGRKGWKPSKKPKKEELQKTQTAWEALESQMYNKIRAPLFNLSENQKDALTYDQIYKLREEAKSKKTLFHSTVRKTRVLNSRAMWTVMDYEKYPDKNFKKSYFVYQASKESDGFLLRPYGFQSAKSD